jgi:hypothetical protein
MFLQYCIRFEISFITSEGAKREHVLSDINISAGLKKEYTASNKTNILCKTQVTN